MTVFISGGCKNGKSTLAQNLAVKLAENAPLYYVATMIAHDGEDERRIERHVADRQGLGFITLERGTDILGCLESADAGGTFLLDSVTALLSNEMFMKDGFHPEAAEKTADELLKLAKSVKNAVFVSDFIYSDTALYDEYTERYRRGLALCDRALAAECGAVVEVCAGNYFVHKGLLP